MFDGEHVAARHAARDARTARCTISSAGKTFSCTGWKIGWACGPPELVRAVRTAKQFLTYVERRAVPARDRRRRSRLPDAYFDGFARRLRGKRDRLCAGLPRPPASTCSGPPGTYFVTADIRAARRGRTGSRSAGRCRERAGVVAVPTRQVFYDDVAAGRPLVRFAFCKRDEVLDEAAARLAGLRAWRPVSDPGSPT